MNKLLTFTLGAMVCLFFACTELQQIATQIPQNQKGIGNISNAQIANGLKQALEFGVNEGVEKLAGKDGYFTNELTRILLPTELQKVDNTLRKIGLGKLADQGLKVINTAASDAVLQAKPIFINAVKQMNFADAKNILLGNDMAATNYLKDKTSQQLQQAFLPNISQSLNKVGANKIWGEITNKYNAIAQNKINPDLNDYVTQQAINGLFNMVAEKEKGIRQKASLRNTDLLKKVFALQD